MSASLSDLPPNIQSLVSQAKDLYKESFGEDEDPKFCASAPGRVNLIGEHTDYTGGFVLPLAIGYNTVVYGRGCIVNKSTVDAKKSRIVSTNKLVVEFHVSPDTTPLESNDSWANYAIGVLLQYLPCLNPNETFVIDMAIAGDVPLGSGLSSSASLEVATAVFLESIVHDGDEDTESLTLIPSKEVKMERAKRCQRAENVFCNVPCGIMDQFVSSCGCDGKLLLIDCRSLDFHEISLGGGGEGEESNNNVPVLVIANSNVKHSLGDSQYPIRVQQCKDATAILSKCNPQIKSLRDAKMEDIETAKSSAGLEGVLLQRARHVVSENNRTLATAEALENSKFEEVGKLMNESHSSMKDDYETSCGEIDILQDLARRFSGVFGSRLTGGGFGGCTVTLVAKDRAQGLIEYLKEEYKKETGKQCDCFVTSPGSGARVILL